MESKNGIMCYDWFFCKKKPDKEKIFDTNFAEIKKLPAG